MENGYLISDRLVPGNVLYYRAWQFDSSGWWRRWKRYFDLLLPASSQEEISRQIQQLEQLLGRRVESEILSAFGNEMAIACYDPSRWLHMREQKVSSENFPCSLMIRLPSENQSNILSNQLLRFLFPASLCKIFPSINSIFLLQ
jgi:hypothetical protein